MAAPATEPSTEKSNSQNKIVPFEIIDQSIGSSIWIIMKRDIELVGIITGIDEFVNIALRDVTQFETLPDGSQRISTIPKMILNGNNVCMLVPGSRGPLEAEKVGA